MVRSAADDPASLAAFVVDYWPPVYAYIRRAGRSPQDAEDLTQSFFAALLANPRLLQSAQPGRGRFRSFLLTATRNFLVDEHRRERGRDGRRPKPLSIDRSILQKIEPSEADDPAVAFDRQWATIILDLAIRRLESACANEGMVCQWNVFESRVLQPACRGHAPASIEQMMAELGATCPQEVYSMVQTMKRRLNRELLAVVRETLDDPANAQAEVADLLHALARPR